MKILVLNGPNLNLLGTREPGIYGVATLQQIENNLKSQLASSRYELEFYQSNHEGNLVDKIQSAITSLVKFIIINPAAYTHTSVAIRDALLASKIPFIEVHLSNVHAREPFRQHSYLSDAAIGVICGLGAHGYNAAMEYAIKYLQQQEG
ncbi:MAG: type II 3-dehydroquinate dehydratase [Neisseriales bacterium]|jgi:3-dehydroquinate dehydratase-2|nr:MAG: type II 3-dehydroquinate dehydratase [Neisseriales bacterium]